MDLQHLRTFRVVARERSITRAAAVLHCAQSTVTEQIRSLEASLGVVLFRRRGRYPLELTQAGLLLQRRGEHILHMVESVRNEVRQACAPASAPEPSSRPRAITRKAG
ncbi:LysR family transcriptional regulator [Streptomyces sp. NPDC032472]|uniref:LysR family transcriptional regulator n=1 Tax=Streptomyces sp. NPDC032472 TaxID=3155018 RepID=UPI0033CC614A